LFPPASVFPNATWRGLISAVLYFPIRERTLVFQGTINFCLCLRVRSIFGPASRVGGRSDAYPNNPAPDPSFFPVGPLFAVGGAREKFP